MTNAILGWILGDVRMAGLSELFHFVSDERAAALVDYALITSLFAILCVASLNLLRTQTGTNLNRTTNNLTNMGYTP